MPRSRNRGRRDHPNSPMSDCLSPVQLDVLGFSEFSVPPPEPRGPMPGPMPIIPPYQNSSFSSSDSETASANGTPQRQQHYSRLASIPPTPDNSQGDRTVALRPPGRLVISPRSSPSSPPDTGNSMLSRSVTSPGRTTSLRSPNRELSPPSIRSLSQGSVTPKAYPDNRGYSHYRGQSPSYQNTTSPTITAINGALPPWVAPSARGQSPVYPTPATPLALAYRPTPPPPALLSGSGLPMDPNPFHGGAVISTTTSSMMYTSAVSGSVQTPPLATQFPTMYTSPSIHTQSTSSRDTRLDQRTNQMNFYPPQPSPSHGSSRNHLSEQRTDSMSDGSGYREVERMENLGRLLTTGSEGRRGGRTQAAAEIEEHRRDFIPPPSMCPYHPRIRLYSAHQLEPHLIMRYGSYQQRESPYMVTFNETYPCGTSALKPAKRSKLSRWFPCFFET